MAFINKTLLSLLLISMPLCNAAPEVLSKYLPTGEFVKASMGMVFPPKEIAPYLKMLEKAAFSDPKWFKEYTKEFRSGEPLPFHEKLGMTQADYDQYIALWEKRSFQEVKPVAIRLEEGDDGLWMIRTSDPAFAISTLRFDAQKMTLKSPNGELTRVDDVDTSPASLLGAWFGEEWRHSSETSISKTQENFAIGKLKDQNLGYLIYRIQELSSSGRKLYDNRLVIRFPITPKK